MAVMGINLRVYNTLRLFIVSSSSLTSPPRRLDADYID